MAIRLKSHLVLVLKKLKCQKGYLLLEVLLTASIVVMTLPIGFYGYKTLLEEKKLNYFTSELTGMLEESQLRALSHGKFLTFLVDNTRHQVIVQEGMSILLQYHYDSEINVIAKTHQLSFTIYSNGHLDGAGKWEITIGNRKEWLIFNVGQGRFHVEK